MSQSPVLRRYRINPVEVVIFSTVALLLCGSLYNLFYGYDDIRLSMENHWEKTQGRTIASITSVAIDCEKENASFSIPSPTIQVAGNLCRAPEALDVHNPSLKSEVIQLRTGARTPAKILSPDSGGLARFESNAITLETGANPLRVEITYPDGTQVDRDIQVTRK